mmetsp:Transcript_26048/g.34170  ORF Transcript_26048/g.34170 Transcript_26048/m.34170 type:complete len:356 (+) Transcript_26048:77-1144(+)
MEAQQVEIEKKITKNLESESNDDEYTAAGILPYCILGGDVLFLLGKEKFYQYVDKPNDSETRKSKMLGLLWSDFGGRREEADQGQPERTAAREFAEETFGMFEGTNSVAKKIEQSSLSMFNVLNSKEKYGTEIFKVTNGQYVMFIAPVPFVDDLMLNLAREQQLEHNSNLEVESHQYQWQIQDDSSSNSRESEQGKEISKMGYHPEKLDFAWVPADALAQTLIHNRGKSRRKVCLELGDCRVFHMFHKFVFTLYSADLEGIMSILQSSKQCIKMRNGRTGEELIRPYSRVGCKRQRLGILDISPEIHKKNVAEIKARKNWELIISRQKRKKKKKGKKESKNNGKQPKKKKEKDEK